VAQERLWWAISDRQGTQLWLNPVDQLELTVGGAFSIRTYDENNPAAWTSGIVTEVQPPQVLEYTWNQGPYAGGPALQAKVRYELEPESEGTATTSHVLYDVTGVRSHVSTQMSESSAAIQQIASESQQIVGTVKTIGNLSKMSSGEVQNVSAATEEQLASIEEIAVSSEALSKLAQELQDEVAKFRV
jgi:uncharacterized protein YndB with AHSA1/START domain